MPSLTNAEKIQTISNCLTPYLSWNDVLRFRRTCKTTKRLADQFLQSKKIACNSEVEINEEDKTMSNFLQLNFHITKFYLNNSVSGADFFETSQFQKFMDMHSMSITHLRLHQLPFYLVRNEFKFFLCLENLSHLEIGKIVDDEERVTREMIIRFKISCAVLSHVNKTENDYFYPFYQHLGNLKYLKIGAETDAELGNMALFADISLKKLNQLSHLCLSSFFTNLKITTKETEANDLAYLHAILTSIQERAKDSSLKKLQTFEFNDNSYDVFTGGPDHKDLLLNVNKISGVMDIVAFLKICLKNGTSLENVNAALFNGMNRLKMKTKKETKSLLKGTGKAIRSLVNLHYSMLSIKMPNLERLVIQKTSQTSIGKDLSIRPHWPKLRVLRVHADSYMLLPAPASDTHFQDLLEGNPLGRGATYVLNCLTSLWTFLFHQVSRPALRDLDLSFAIELSSLGFMSNDLPLPNVMDITSACPNLTRLTLTNWFGSDKSLVTLWKGLGALEEVCLDSCENVGNVTFAGNDRDGPVFLKLKNLKKLTLKGLERMPQITDLSFIRVFRNLKLKEFYLQSELPLASITYIGIRSLLKGDFAKSIEKFPFNGFKLDEKYTSLEKLQFLEAQFRSSLLL